MSPKKSSMKEGQLQIQNFLLSPLVMNCILSDYVRACSLSRSTDNPYKREKPKPQIIYVSIFNEHLKVDEN